MPNHTEAEKNKNRAAAARKARGAIAERSQFKAVEEVNKILGAVVQFLAQRKNK